MPCIPRRVSTNPSSTTSSITRFASPATSGVHVRPGGAALLTIADADKPEIFPIVSRLVQMGCTLVATEGTARALQAAGFSPRVVAKIGEEGPTVLDAITNG